LFSMSVLKKIQFASWAIIGAGVADCQNTLCGGVHPVPRILACYTAAR
jgi:hypothetical protein